jgi:hypothetical protein
MRLPFLLLLLLSTTAPAQGYKAVKDWVGACDNTRHCTAFGFSPDVNEDVSWVLLERGGGPDDGVEKLRVHFDVTIPPGARVSLAVGTTEVLLGPGHRGVPVDEETPDIEVTDRAEIDGLLAAMRNASELQLNIDGNSDRHISLAGISAVLLWIDEQQQRLGTTSALIRKGPARASAVVPVPPAVYAQLGATHLGDAEIATLTKALRATLEADSCEEPDADRGSMDDAWRLDATQVLIQLTCFAGAYNFGSNWYLLRGNDAPQPLQLPVPETDGSGRMRTETLFPRSASDLINADFDPASATLSQFSKGRGVGDCGVSSSWVWDGKRFALSEYLMMDTCRGVGPELWPAIWRTR